MPDQASEIGAYYDDFWRGTDPAGLAEHAYRDFQADLFAFVDGALGSLDGLRVLEVGPGLGLDTVRLARRGAEVWAVDVSRASLDIVAGRCAAAGVAGQVHVLMMNGETLALPDASFDLAYVQCTLMHADWPRIVRECHRVLRPGGRALFVEPLRHHPLVAVYRATLSHCKTSHPRYLSWADMRRIGGLFLGGQMRPFYLLSPAALGLRRLPVYPLARRLLQALDRQLLKPRLLQPLAWYGVALYER